MSKIQLLRVFLYDRLTAAAEEIFGVVEKTVAEYQEEVVRLQRLLDIVLQPEINLQRAGRLTRWFPKLFCAGDPFCGRKFIRHFLEYQITTPTSDCDENSIKVAV